MAWLPDGVKILICLFVLTQLTNVADRHTHRQTPHALCIASCGKNRELITAHGHLMLPQQLVYNRLAGLTDYSIFA